jgi:hypothetical protein
MQYFAAVELRDYVRYISDKVNLTLSRKIVPSLVGKTSMMKFISNRHGTKR